MATDAVVKDGGLGLHLVCDQCGGFICQIDEDDYLSILVQTITEHECAGFSEPSTGGE